MRQSLLVCAAVAAVACSSKKSTPSATQGSEHAPGSAARPEGPGGSAASAAPGSAVPPPAADLAAAIDAAFAAAKLTLPPTAPLDPAVREPDRFLGWSKDGTSYLVRATYEVPEEPGLEGIGFSLVEVHEAITQRATERYQDSIWPSRQKLGSLLKKHRASDAEDVPLALWDSAKPRAQAELAERFIEVGKVVPGKPDTHARSSSGDARLAASARGSGPYKSTFAVTDAPYGFSYAWSGFAAEPHDDSAKTRSPGIAVVATTKAGTFQLVTIASTHTYETLYAAIDASEPTVAGEIRAYWSPAGTHVAFSVLETVDGGHEEFGFGMTSRSFVRSLGPQIKVVAAGVSYDRARKAAALITHAGHPVTVVEQATAPVRGAVIYYRGDAGKQAADAIAKLLPGTRAEALTKPGWLDVIVMLGA